MLKWGAILFQVHWRFPVEAFVLSFHMSESGEIVRIDVGQIHLKGLLSVMRISMS